MLDGAEPDEGLWEVHEVFDACSVDLNDVAFILLPRDLYKASNTKSRHASIETQPRI